MRILLVKALQTTAKLYLPFPLLVRKDYFFSKALVHKADPQVETPFLLRE